MARTECARKEDEAEEVEGEGEEPECDEEAEEGTEAGGAEDKD